MWAVRPLLLCVSFAVAIPRAAGEHIQVVHDDGSELPWDYYWDPDQEVPRGLFPNVFNLATNAVITANATCGETGPETYCKLVEHVFDKEPQCGVCDAISQHPEKRHLISNAIDGTNKWWQSPTLQNGRKYQWVTITLDLGQIYQIAYVIVKAAISPRPGNWILERSLDGFSYKPWQYYAIHDTECWEVYGIRPTIGKPRYRSDDEVICTSFYSKLNPFENGEIHTSLVNGRPGVDGPSLVLTDFTKARYIRLRLQKIRTLNADLMTLQANNSEKLDKSVTRRYFYSIKDISIGGQCLCLGHAEECPIEGVTGNYVCKCEHDTCGATCEKCCPLYNQVPWRAGTTDDGAACEKCECFGHADECYYDPKVAEKRTSLNSEGKHEGGGVCINCKNNTGGNNCEMCLDGYYRPPLVTRHDPDPCRKCDCLGRGCTGLCIKDDSHIDEGLYPGDCLCKVGFVGRKCENCAPGYKNYPMCEPCPCNFAGTVDGTLCEGECICKKNVEGDRCDRCKKTFFNLAANNPDGCSPCFCFGITSVCESSDWGIEIVKKLPDWKVTDLKGKRVLVPMYEDGKLIIANDDMPGLDNYYWLAPPDYLGKKLYAYGSNLKFMVSYVVARGDTSGTYTDASDVILEGNDMMIGYSWGKHIEEDNTTLAVPLREQGWFILTAAGKPGREVTRENFTLVLNRLNHLMIRAKFHTDQIEGTIYNIEMEVAAVNSTSVTKSPGVERCQCPPGYAGLSCELCAPGYRRINNTLVNGVCERCDCNNHAESCDTLTGQCQNCLHHTTGPKCDRCKTGYYGNPLVGTPFDCKRCACPLENEENNFSPTCRASLDTKGDYVCTDCPVGYQGLKCEHCAHGYFGNPHLPGGFCQPCDCSGNVNKSEPSFCDPVTGQCLKCLGNTGGWNCEECLPGHYGNPKIPDCRPCSCSSYGSESMECDQNTGQCQCKPHFIGKTCNKCADGFGNVDVGCVRCHCNPVGSHSLTCDPITGQCPCKPGVFGSHCDQCLDGYYGFSNAGCHWCGCDVNGALSTQCDEITGQCRCKSLVAGRACDKCEAGYWNLISGKGCERCNCNVTGSVSQLCNELYGHCNCKPGVGGKMCDSCLPGHYGFSIAGCRKCDPCDAPGHICDPKSGRCICPPYTTGHSCHLCAPGAWGYDPVHGCKPCNCSRQGSASQECDSETGTCTCLEGFEGRTCGQCRFGFFNFPNCRRCKCQPDGSEPKKCSPEGRCQCDEKGQCPCRENTVGKKCDRCKEGTFGMTVDNPKGCYECFCFGKSRICEQSKMVWSEIGSHSREVRMEVGDTPLTSLYGLQVIPGQKGNEILGIPYVLDKPLYWVLPQQFLGDKVLSYNGILKFRIESHSGSRFPDALLTPYPLILLQGNHRLVLTHSNFQTDSGGYYVVALHESEWKQHDNPHVPVTREILMVVLQNLQHILIRATEGADVKFARISNVTLEVAVPVSPTPPSPYVSMGVEMCRCPPQYTASSCQDPAQGYYRKRKPNYLDSKDILDLVGWAEPCPCNNRSRSCDKETGICFNCTGNTAGPFCNVCTQGYFGDPTRGPCRRCACPTVTSSFSDTCRPEGLDYICTCQQGYTGRHCEKCTDGYYGSPLERGGACLHCNCNPYGSHGRTCDKVTGQCDCLEGITGRDCTKCMPRYLLTEYGCKPCDDECTGELLDQVEYLVDMISSVDLSGISHAPWGYMNKIRNGTFVLRHNLEKYILIIRHGKQVLGNFSFYFDLESYADILFMRARDAVNNASYVSLGAEEIVHDAQEFLKSLDKLWDEILAIVDYLRKHGMGTTQPGLAISRDLAEAEKILRELRSRNFALSHEEADRELRKARNLLDRVRNMTVDRLRIDGLNDRLNHLNTILRELLTRIQEDVRRPTIQALAEIQQNRAALDEVNYANGQTRKLSQEINVTLAEAQDLLNKAKNAIIDASIKFESLPHWLRELDNATEQVEHRRGILDRLNPEYQTQYVIPAQRHADSLEKQAEFLVALFNQTRQISDPSLRAAMAYKEIVEALDAAEEAARQAYAVAERAYAEAYPLFGDALTAQAQRAKALSERLLKEAKELRNVKVPELRGDLHRKKKILDKITEDIAYGRRSLEVINRGLDMLPFGVADVIKGAEVQYKKTMNNLKNTHRKVDGILELIENKLKPQVAQLVVGSPESLGNITKIIDKARSDIKESSKKAENARILADRVVKQHNHMQLNLKELRDKILLARQKASSIRVSLSPNKMGQCSRSYKPDVQPTTYNNIILNYAIKSEAQDSLLFFLGSAKEVPLGNEPDDYMAIEMVGRKIRFLWNAGGGTKMIQHSTVIETNDQQLLQDHQWYKIEATRIGNIGTLSVKRTPDGQRDDLKEVTGASPVGFSKMDLDSSSHFFIGGLPKSYKPPRELKSKAFSGCLYEVIMDGKKVGLWNFLTNEGCDGCKEGATEIADLSAYQFKGDGYAILPQIRGRSYNSQSYTISLGFRTFDEDALIFFCPNTAKGDFISLELRDGKVVYRFRIGNRPPLTLKTKKKYNTGKWVSVVASREMFEGFLSVDGETDEGKVSSPGSPNLDLKNSQLYYGGVPPNFTASSWTHLTFQNFLGCMKDLQIETATQDLLQYESYGIESSCTDKAIKVVSFKGDGYVELKSHTLGEESSFGFSFQTIQRDALLLLSTFTDKEKAKLKKDNYYSVSLVDGQLEVRFNGGSGETKITTTDLVLNDGTYHTITVSKVHRQVYLMLDDNTVGKTRTHKKSKLIEAPEDGGLYFGGIPDFNIGNMAPTRQPFKGTIKDAIFNDKLLHFNEPVSFVGVGIGRSAHELHKVNSDLMAHPVERCAEMESYTVEKRAVKFGDSLDSHVKLTVGKKDFNKNFNISLNFRTFFPNGLIMLVKNGKRAHYMAVTLHGGKVSIDILDKTFRTISSHGGLNDGKWHDIVVSKVNNKLTLTVDSSPKFVTTKIRRKMPVRSPIFVGGLPEKFPVSEKLQVKESFKGCIRDYHISGKYIDLASSDIHGVGNCFTKIEPGGYFAGDAYAVFDTNFNLDLKLDLTLEFKTTRLNGVLLSLSDPSGRPSLALEIFNGKVIVTVNTGIIGVTASKTFHSKYEMCDGKWHRVTIHYSRNSVTLKVDTHEVAYGVSDIIPTPPRTSSPLFIGGIPDFANKGSLHIRDNFIGCLRNIAVNEKRVDWRDMAQLKNVLPNSCPMF